MDQVLDLLDMSPLEHLLSIYDTGGGGGGGEEGEGEKDERREGGRRGEKEGKSEERERVGGRNLICDLNYQGMPYCLPHLSTGYPLIIIIHVLYNILVCCCFLYMTCDNTRNPDIYICIHC